MRSEPSVPCCCHSSNLLASFFAFKTLGRTATAAAMVVQPLSFAATLLASTWLVCQLRNVHDSTNLGRDIALVGRAMVITLCECHALPKSFRFYIHVCVQE